MTSPNPPENRPARVDELDGLRGLLALWVALGHMCAWCGYWELKDMPGLLGGVWYEFIKAEAAVDTFIILSGFAITFLLHAKRQSWGAFMTGRVFRIYPAYLVCLILGVVSTFFTIGILDTATWKETIYFEWIRALATQESAAFTAHTFWHLTLVNGLLFKSFLPGATGTILTPAWSITLEWQYYLVAPLVARMVKWIPGLLMLAAVGYLGVHFSERWQNPQLAFFPSHLLLFLVGIASYHLYASSIPVKKLLFFGGMLGLIAAGFVLPSGDPGSKISVMGAVKEAGALLGRHIIGMGIWTVVFGSILMREGAAGKAAGMLRAFLMHPMLQGLGKISFPLYLVHWPVIIFILAVLLRFAPGISQGAALAVLMATGVPIVLVLARLLHVHVETPGMALGKKVARRAPATVQPEAAGS